MTRICTFEVKFRDKYRNVLKVETIKESVIVDTKRQVIMKLAVRKIKGLRDVRYIHMKCLETKQTILILHNSK